MSLRKAIVVVLLVLGALALKSNNLVLAANPSALVVAVQKGDPVLGGVSSAVTFQVFNPAANINPVTNFTVLQPPGWSLVSCLPGSVNLTACHLGSSKLSFTGSGLPPGAAVSLGMTLVPPTGTYPNLTAFSTLVRDASAPNVTYSGPVFSLMIIDPTTTVSVTPSGTLGFVAGSSPLTVTATLAPSQGGVPISFVVLGYGPLDTYNLVQESANTTSSGAVSASFSPSSNNGATATILVMVGTSVINGSSGRITTLSPGPSVILSPGSGPAGTPVTLSGSGFLVGSVLVDFSSQLVGSTNVTSTGSPFAVQFKVPNAPPGVYVVRASGLGGVTAAGVFDLVTALDFGLSLSSNSTLVGPGQPFSTNVSASVLAGISGVVSFSVSAQAGVTTPVLSPSVGALPFQASLNGIAPISAGTFTYTVTASVGNLTHDIRFAIVVPPSSISLSTNSSLPGDSVTLTGQDFPPLASIIVTLNQTEVNSTQTDAAGSFQVDFVVPSVGPGNYTVGVAGGGAPSSAPFVVLAAPSSTTTTGGGPPVLWTYVAVAGGITAGGLAIATRLIPRPPKPDDIRFTVEVVPEEEVTAREEEG